MKPNENDLMVNPVMLGELFRPYVTTDFEYTGGVIPYIGIEQYKWYGTLKDFSEIYEVLDRREKLLD